MSYIDYEDWKDFWSKLKWQLISFKFLSFWAYTLLLLFFWYSIEHLHKQTILTSQDMLKNKLITSPQLSDIIKHSQTTLYDVALSHILIFLGTIITAIIAVKGVSYVTQGQKERSIINKLSDNPENNENLKKFLPKKGK